MVASVELVLERGERLELLVDKTDNLQQQVTFQQQHDCCCELGLNGVLRVVIVLCSLCRVLFVFVCVSMVSVSRSR